MTDTVTFEPGETIVGPCGWTAEYIEPSYPTANGEACVIIEEYSGDQIRVKRSKIRKIPQPTQQ